MQGTGKTAPDGDYIKYAGGGGCFVRIAGPCAGRDLEYQWVENPHLLRSRYPRLGITDFTGFGNLAISYSDCVTYSRVSSITGSTGRTLTSWFSIAVDPSVIPLGQTGTLVFKDAAAARYGLTKATFRADDVGPSTKGKRIDIYLGEGESAINKWLQSGGNRFVDIYRVR